MSCTRAMRSKLLSRLAECCIALVLLGIISMFVSHLVQQKANDHSLPFLQINNTITHVDVRQMTKGLGELTQTNQQYRIGAYTTAFGYEGQYQGKPFRMSYVDETGRARMAITPDLSPNNGIAEAMLVERYDGDKKNGAWNVLILVDEDFRKLVPDAVIRWGADYSQQKPFVWKEASPGIYFDLIADDESRFSQDYSTAKGGVLVGSVGSLEHMQNATFFGIH